MTKRKILKKITDLQRPLTRKDYDSETRDRTYRKLDRLWGMYEKTYNT